MKKMKVKVFSLYKKMFTLIELIVVIVVLGILAAIIVPNVAEQKKEATTSMLTANIRDIQTATDTYALKNNGQFPTVKEPSITEPQLIDFNLLYPSFIKSLPDEQKVKNQKYWVDAYGQVWGATIPAPEGITKSASVLEWTHNENAKEYVVYELSKNTMGAAKKSFIKPLMKIKAKEDIERIAFPSLPDKSYLISSVDAYGLQTAPSGLSQFSQDDWFSPILNKEGSFIFELSSDKTMYFDEFSTVEDKPEGTDIIYEFATLDSSGKTFKPLTSNFGELTPSKELQVKVTLKKNGTLYPSLLDLKVFYHFEGEEWVKGKTVSTQNVQYNQIEGTYTIINPNQSVRIVDEFQLQSNPVYKVITNDRYPSSIYEPTYSYSYSKDNGGSYQQSPSLSELPTGATHLRVERYYPAGKDLYVEPLRIYTKEEVNILNSELEEGHEGEYQKVSSMNFFANTTNKLKANWLRVDAKETKPEHTRIRYVYSYSDDTEWYGEYSDINNVPDSKRLKVSVIFEVEKEWMGKVEEPEIQSLKIFSDQGENPTSDQDIPIQLYPDIVPALMSNSNQGVVVQASSTFNQPYHQVFTSFDDKVDGQGWSAHSSTGWIEIGFDYPQIAKGYTLDVRDMNVANQMPKNWTFEGLNPSTNQWVSLDDQVNQTDWRGKRVYPISNNNLYKSYRLNVTANNGHSYLSIGEIEIIGEKQVRNDFTGSNYVQLPTMNIDYSQGLTFSFWANPTEVKTWSRFIDFGNGSASDNIVITRSDRTNNLAFYIFSGANAYYLEAVNALALNEWQHFSVTVESNRTVKIYKNGQLAAQGTATSLPSSMTRTKNYIGLSNWSPTGPDEIYKGNMSELQMWNRPLTQSEIKTYSQQPLTGNENGLIGYWKLNAETQGADSSPSALHGVWKP